jgi:hypothetical protein
MLIIAVLGSPAPSPRHIFLLIQLRMPFELLPQLLSSVVWLLTAVWKWLIMAKQSLVTESVVVAQKQPFTTPNPTRFSILMGGYCNRPITLKSLDN